jgi:hypothetical protein
VAAEVLEDLVVDMDGTTEDLLNDMVTFRTVLITMMDPYTLAWTYSNTKTHIP